MNIITISGRLTKKPELKQTSTNKYVSDFSLAVNRGTKDENGNYEVDFVNCRCWNKLAENLCKYQDMGDYIIVNGSLRVEHYSDKEGKNRQAIYVLVENIDFIPKPKVNEPKKAEKQDNTNDVWEKAQDMNFSEDELPFYN